MYINKKILSLSLLTILSITAYANGIGEIQYTNRILAEKKDNVMTIDVFINNNSKIQMVDVPTIGRLEVYSILGLKVDSKILSSTLNSYYLELPKGIYILKAGKVAQKVIAK